MMIVSSLLLLLIWLLFSAIKVKFEEKNIKHTPNKRKTETVFSLKYLSHLKLDLLWYGLLSFFVWFGIVAYQV